VTGFRALVLAGSRGGVDPAAAYAGVSHKALIELGGQTLLARVVGALSRAGATSIAVSTNDPAVTLAAHALDGQSVEVSVLDAAGGPSLSVAQGARTLGTPLLVTTADHALLEPDWVQRFLADVPPDADIAALLAPEAAVRAAAPETQRSYLAFKDGRYSGCNLFYLRNDKALAVIELWRQVEAYRKQPWKIAALIGPGMLVGYLTGRLTLDAAVARIGAKVGVAAVAVRTPYGAAAIDVDKPADLDLVRKMVES
jgi:CTP:molybdopterin cytidylyltransferase MocA